MTLIKVISNGKGEARAVNPFKKAIMDIAGHAVDNPEWQDFERTVQSLPIYKSGKIFLEPGEVEAEPVWQAWSQKQDWYTLPVREWKKLKTYGKTRQVFEVLEPATIEAGEENGMSQEDLEWLQGVQSKAESLYRKDRMPERDFMLLDRVIDTIFDNNGLNNHETDI